MAIEFKKTGTLEVDDEGKVAEVVLYMEGEDDYGRISAKSDSVEYAEGNREPKAYFTKEVLEGMIPSTWEAEITTALGLLAPPIAEEDVIDL